MMMQEWLMDHVDGERYEWAMFVGCMLLNQTSWEAAEPLLDGLLEEFPSWLELRHADLDELEEFLEPIGLPGRAERLIEMSKEYHAWRQQVERSPLTLPGVGQYGEESWQIFVCGRIPNIVVDKELNAYVHRRGLNLIQSQVDAFHAKNSFPRGVQMKNDCPTKTELEVIRLSGKMLVTMSESCLAMFVEEESGSPVLLRTSLMLEELGEALLGLGNLDEVETLDGLADLIYVIAGTAVSCDLPLQAAVQTVHESNMTKAVRNTADTRLRDKGHEYVPPNIHGALADHRQKA